MPTSLHRWLVFNAVGALGFLVQMAALVLLMEWLHWNYVPATALAVEAAVVHNFLWHQHWTWADRAPAGRARAWRRFACFNLTNGLLSIAGNLVFMRLFMDALPVNYAAANAMAIAACAILNYIASDRLVFPGAPVHAVFSRHRAVPEPNQKRGSPSCAKSAPYDA
jgi:putative flippase GtrA